MVLVSLMSRFFSTTSSQIILTSKNAITIYHEDQTHCTLTHHVTLLTNNTATNMSAFKVTTTTKSSFISNKPFTKLLQH